MATARTTDRNAVLINTAGKVLASFNALFPRYGTQSQMGDPRVEQVLDRCMRDDPTVAPKYDNRATQMICTDPKLEKLSRATELVYYKAQAGTCLPQEFLKLRPAFDEALAACTTDTCIKQTLLHFQASVAQANKTCEPGEDGLQELKTPVDRRSRAAIKTFLAKVDDGFADDAKFASESGNAISFHRVKLGKMPAVIVYGYSQAANGPFWLVTRAGHHGWRLLLSASGSGGPETAGSPHNGMPILMVSSTGGCCDAENTYYQYDGTHYRERNDCNILFVGDDEHAKEIAVCGKPKTTR